MTNREFFLQRRKAEFPVFLRVLTALPSDQLSYKPHERCSSAQQIVATLTGELKSCLDAATTYKGEWTNPPAASHAEAAAEHRQQGLLHVFPLPLVSSSNVTSTEHRPRCGMKT
jgi:hypothetical protein